MAFARQSNSVDCRTGLKQQSANPAARNSSELIRLPKPASKMSRVSEISGSALISRASAMPSMSGIVDR